MSFQPFRCTVTANRVLSPSFQRLTLAVNNSADFGPAPSVSVRDLRVKLIIPPADPLVPGEDWYRTWLQTDPARRGTMRTYSLREVRRNPDSVQVDIDVVRHPEAAGPASSWATQASPGDELTMIAPTRDDASESGIEFHPPAGSRAILLGDETAAPAIARCLEDLPSGVHARAFIEVPEASDQLDIRVPEGSTVTWLPRSGPRGRDLQAALDEVVDRASISDIDDPESFGPEPWSVPTDAPEGGDYFWIAGESKVVVALRRYLVREAGVEKSRIAFMGYWREGVAMRS
ncbi:siderophore-interacting protein [Corynebacterium tapiri]|uniref:Siderophore-interacting protein n=1 Tax=Corynebacterium tapiri TaxID=1448266 RepID=A0A5C4U5D6_9CORY|nr:siderophore-interacting protein [Corynebacterium tapiri]TNL98470.1 siderophore-interacting protein [Corynebacterium tapiri]